MSLNAYSQKIVLSDDKKDTLICFNQNQARYLLLYFFSYQSCDTLKKVTEQQLSICKEENNRNEIIIEQLEKINDNCNRKVSVRDVQIADLQKKLIYKDTEIKRQKTYKNLSICASIFFAGCFGYYTLSLR
jgi:hypothetical protein